jgi:N-glycosylase/DNA lyase
MYYFREKDVEEVLQDAENHLERGNRQERGNLQERRSLLDAENLQEKDVEEVLTDVDKGVVMVKKNVMLNAEKTKK